MRELAEDDLFALFPDIPRVAVLEALETFGRDEPAPLGEAKARAHRIALDHDRERHQWHLDLIPDCYPCALDAGDLQERLRARVDDVLAGRRPEPGRIAALRVVPMAFDAEGTLIDPRDHWPVDHERGE